MSTGTSDAPYEAEIREAANQTKCSHGLTFDDVVARRLSGREIARRWPRLDGLCPLGCGYCGIAYASYAHYIAGGW